MQASPKTGYVWPDGTGSAVTFDWEIAKKTITCSYKDLAVGPDEVPNHEGNMKLSGFVAGETADTAEGFIMPAITPPAELVPGETYRLTSAGGAAEELFFQLLWRHSDGSLC